MKYSIKLRLDLNIIIVYDRYGVSPLLLCAEGGNEALVRLLVAVGAEVVARCLLGGLHVTHRLAGQLDAGAQQCCEVVLVLRTVGSRGPVVFNMSGMGQAWVGIGST